MISERTKQIMILLHEEKERGHEGRSLGYIAKKLNMLYPSVHNIVSKMEHKEKLIKTIKHSEINHMRFVTLTKKGEETIKQLIK